MLDDIVLTRSAFLRLSAGAALGTTGIISRAEKRSARVASADNESNVDQVGYQPDIPKIGMITSDSSTFRVRESSNDQTVLTGSLSRPSNDPSSGDTVRQADFSQLTRPGNYVLELPDGDVSYPFSIGEDVYSDSLIEAGRSYSLIRSGTAIDDSVTGLQFAAGHTQDSHAKMYFSDQFHEKGDTIDVAGGWYDAGDYGKYIPTAAVTVGQLLLAYEMNPETFVSGQFDLPEGSEQRSAMLNMPDLLTEVKYELEWMEKMQRPDGAVYHKVSGKDWPAMDVKPAEDDQQRYVFGLSTYGTAEYAGAMAMASRVYSDYAPEFADRMLANARSAYEYLKRHPEPKFRYDEGQNSGSGAYRKDTDREERFWAVSELLKTTGDREYDEFLKKNLNEKFTVAPHPINWADAVTLGQWAYYSGEAGDPENKRMIRQAVLAYADDLVEHIEADEYNCALTPDQYIWGSARRAMAEGNILLLANEMESKSAYVEGALDQLHYIFGRTPTGHSYMTGQGKNAPRNVHNRIMVSTGEYIPGLVVGGPNKNGQDPILSEFIEEESIPPAKAYLDSVESYASNEYAIDYTAPVLFALAYTTPTS
jgi:endoglucanase